jgi:pimeloyl-ACP methyl ester carboxylesterase
MAKLGRLRLRRRSNPLERLAKRELEIDDVVIRAHELWRLDPDQAAQPDLPTFVLVHGLGVSSRYFVPLAELLADHGRVVLFDLPGFGGLPEPERPLEIADYAQIVRRALEALDVPGDPLLIGHSMGCQVVVEVLAADHGFARRAVLLAPVINPKERALRQVIGRFLQSAVWENPVHTAVAVTAYVQCPPGWWAGTLPRVLAYPIAERLTHLPTRLLIVGGGHDHLSPPSWQVSLTRSLPRAEVVTLPRAAHAMVVDHAREIADQVLRLVGLGMVKQ